MPVAAILTLTIIAEVSATIALRACDGFTKLVPSIIVVVGYAASFVGLGLVLRHMEVGVVYAIWSGAGTALVAAIGMAVLGEPTTAVKIASIGLIVAGVAGLNLGGAH
jgi:small multidrug resistance pump